MIKQKRLDLYDRAYKLWGANQFLMLMEECAELTQATSKLLRDGPTDRVKGMLAEEIGDVEIMIEQMKNIFPELKNKVNYSKDKKLQRLKKIVEKWEDGKV